MARSTRMRQENESYEQLRVALNRHSGHDAIVRRMLRERLPLTRATYKALAGLPPGRVDAEVEATFPPPFQTRLKYEDD